MKVIRGIVSNTNQNSKGNKKHLVYFFGLGESMLDNNECIIPKEGENQYTFWEEWASNKDIHLFDYHYMDFLYPEHFHDTKFRLKRVLITVVTFLVTGFLGYSIITSQMSIWGKLPALLIPLTIAAAIMYYYPIVTSIIKFVTKGKDPIKAGMAIVIDLLEKGVHPDDIILMGNSLGGGVAAEVLKKFKEENIFFTFVHSNSYDSFINVPRFQKSLLRKFSWLTDKWITYCGADYKPNEIINSTKAPVLSTNRVRDMVIDWQAQSVGSFLRSDINKDGFKVLAHLWHRDNIERSKECDNQHTDNLTHMRVFEKWRVKSQKMTSYAFTDRGETYEELLENFIDEAHEYLEKNKLNSRFKLNTFQHSKLYQEIKKNKVSLININSPNSNLSINDESLKSCSSSTETKSLN